MSKAFVPIEPLQDGAWLGKKTTGKQPYWYVRMYWKDGNPPQSEYKSLKIPYEGKRKDTLEARKKGNATFQKFLDAVTAGDSPRKARTVENATKAYLAKITEDAKVNEAAKKPIRFIRGGRAVKGHSQHWTEAKVKAVKNILKELTGYVNEKGEYVSGFYETLPTQDFRKITQRDLYYFSEWAAEQREWSPSWSNRVITQIRMIWLYGFEQGWTDFIPSPKRMTENLRERARRNLTEEEWLRMVRWAEKRYNDIEPTNKANSYYKDTALQFWVWLNVISWSGVRPPSGAVNKNLLRWSDITTLEDGTRLMRRTDKTEYTAPILSPCYKLLDFYKGWQEKKGLKDSEFMFAHTRTKGDYYSKGDPILSFRKQWTTMLDELGLLTPPGTPQSEKLVPYSMRGFFITMSIRNGVDVRKLARSLGTSERVIDQTYYDFQTEKELPELLKRTSIANIGSVSYDENGYPILR